jgi:hypothetical protein
MKNPAAVALGRKRAAKHKKNPEKSMGESMRDLALKRHRSIDTYVVPTPTLERLASGRIGKE